MSVEKYSTKAGTRWRVRYTRPDGTRTDRRGFRTKTEARKWEAQQTTGMVTAPRRATPTLGDVADQFPGSIRHLAAGSQDTYMVSLNRHVLPRWGRTKPDQIRPSSVQQWVDDSGWSRSLAIKNIVVLRKLLALATADDPTFVDPTRDIRKPAPPRNEFPFLTFPQLQALAETSKYPDIIYTLGIVGIRWGELAGLRVRDYQPDKGVLHIWQNAAVIRGKVVIGPPKNGKDRIVAAPKFITRMLDKRVAGRLPDAPIFPGTDGRYMVRPKGSQDWFSGARDRARAADPTFPRVRIHDLRHTAASLMVQSGANVKLVQRQLGHGSAALTLDTYASLWATDLGDLADAMDQQISGWARAGRGQDVGKDGD